MAIFKCKMCGGTIEFELGATVGVCDNCGTKQTLPRLDDEKKANLYDRADHFRRGNDYDKAAAIYEQILNEDNTDAEAYWSLVLCRYGIEYVEDPATHKRVPTVNRAQFTSIFADEDYKSALQYADGYQKTIYEEEAKAIDEIQKGILAISQKEEPFDVFICYKETDNSGRRTQDSVLANDLYHQLTQEGFKVFFSRITLEDKLGAAYEPYIFAALNSAKVMVVLGTKPEYFNAVWVKNEWSRYLALVKNSGGKKMLIPAYRDMDPYDLPEEFSHLQAQDMGKLGFMQDLIRGIKKIISTGTQKPVERETVVTGGNAAVAPLLKRVFLFLEDKNWKEADEYCEKVLDLDPENAEAYLGKLMAEVQVEKAEDLKNCAKPFDGSDNYQKAVRFGSNALKSELTGCIDYINTRNENARVEGIYTDAKNLMAKATAEDAYKKAAALFESIPGYKDADELGQECRQKANESIYANAYILLTKVATESAYNKAAALFESIHGYKNADELVQECRHKAESARKDNVLSRAVHTMAGRSIAEYEAAIEQLKTIPGWKDADAQMDACLRGIEKIHLERKQRVEADRKKAKHKKKIALIIALTICALIAFVVMLITVIIPNKKYNDAVALMNAGDYERAIAAFEAMDGYRDSENLLRSSRQRLLSSASVGVTVIFGTYEQDNNISNGAEGIKWRVLAKEENRILVISKNALDCQPYNTSKTDHVTWETCSLRKWLNSTFLNTAFSAMEQSCILSSSVSADENPYYDTPPGNDTIDQIFLLSVPEVNKYFSAVTAKCTPTDYAIAQGVAYSDYERGCYWWLRSPGEDAAYAANVDYDGSAQNSDHPVHYVDGAVRPAMWIDLGS